MVPPIHDMLTPTSPGTIMTEGTKKYFVKCVSYLLVEGDSKKGVEEFMRTLDLAVEYNGRAITSADLVAIEVTEAHPN